MDHELRPALKECLRLMENELAADGRAGLGTDPSEWIVAMANARAALAPFPDGRETWTIGGKCPACGCDDHPGACYVAGRTGYMVGGHAVTGTEGVAKGPEVYAGWHPPFVVAKGDSQAEADMARILQEAREFSR